MKNELDTSKQLMINMIASLVSCIVSLGISFFLTPYIQETIGYEAVGFVKLATDFVSYATIASTALNSMASRFITIKIHQKDMKTANEYFNSVLFANLGIVGFLMVPAVFLVLHLEKVISISPSLVFDVKILFAAMFINFMITVVGTTFSVATFAANRLDLSSRRTIEANLIRALLIIVLFTFLPVKISYVGVTTLIATLYMIISNAYYTKLLFPQILFGRRFFSLLRVLEILKSGIWNTIMRTGQILNNGLDLLITNVLINEYSMGLLGTAQTIAAAINTLYETIAGVFSPSLTIHYAKGDKESLVSELKTSMRLTGFFANIPLGFVIGFGLPFYNLWLRSSSAPDRFMIYQLTVVIMGGIIVGGAISPLFNVFTIVNKLKYNSLVVLIQGIVKTLLLLIILDTTNLGIWAVASLSSIIGVLKNLTFTPMYAAHCLHISKKTFYPTILRYIFVSTFMVAIFVGMGHILPASNWMWILIDIILCGIVGSMINITLLFEQREKQILLDTLSRKNKNRTDHRN
ncbi:MAG TPA: oligosaccharide flippase family protein [Lachnospiraceae bacterium]|nr:oligosaccharide flippase family protein [Lachnospiraceae bacterium]